MVSHTERGPVSLWPDSGYLYRLFHSRIKSASLNSHLYVSGWPLCCHEPKYLQDPLHVYPRMTAAMTTAVDAGRHVDHVPTLLGGHIAAPCVRVDPARQRQSNVVGTAVETWKHGGEQGQSLDHITTHIVSPGGGFTHFGRLTQGGGVDVGPFFTVRSEATCVATAAQPRAGSNPGYSGANWAG